MTGPLTSLKVLDFSTLLPGPFASLLLADMGAEVLRVESPTRVDLVRMLPPHDQGVSASHAYLNRNKRCIALDLKKPEAVEMVKQLVAEYDIVLEQFRPGVMDKLGLGYETLAGLNPRLVYCSISGYGHTGPYALRAGHDINYIGYAGVLDQIGSAGAAPALSNLQLGDLLGGTMTALFGILVALVDARACGKGRCVDVAMTDAVMAHAIFPLIEVLAQGQVRARGEDLLTGAVPCYGVYRTADDRYMAVGALEEKFWNLVCDTLERPDLKPFHLATGEVGERAKARVGEIFGARTQAEWVAVFDAVDCCVTPVLTLQESLENPQLQARGMITEVGGVRQFGPVLRLSAMPATAARPAPAVAGADSDAVLSEVGFVQAELDRLRQAGII